MLEAYKSSVVHLRMHGKGNTMLFNKDKAVYNYRAEMSYLAEHLDELLTYNFSHLVGCSGEEVYAKLKAYALDYMLVDGTYSIDERDEVGGYRNCFLCAFSLMHSEERGEHHNCTHCPIAFRYPVDVGDVDSGSCGCGHELAVIEGLLDMYMQDNVTNEDLAAIVRTLEKYFWTLAELPEREIDIE